MGAIVLDASKVNSYVLPNLVKSKNTMQDAYSTSQSLRNSLPSSFTYRSTINDIVNQLYNIKREISDIDTMISKKVEKAKTIENRNDNRASGIAKAASSIGSIVGTIGGSAIGAATGGVVGAAAGAYVGNKVGSAVGKGLANTGAKVVKGFVSLCKKIDTGIRKISATIVRKITSVTSKILKGVTDLTKKVTKAYFNVKTKIGNKVISAVEKITGWDLNWIRKANAKVSNFVVTIVDKAGNLINKVYTGIGNWAADLIEHPWATIKKTAACVVNVVMCLLEGVASFIEAVTDGSILLTVAPVTGIIDIFNGVFKGDWSWSATKSVVGKKILPFIARDFVKEGFDHVYNTKAFEWIDENAYKPFKRDGGVIYSVGKGIGYYVGIAIASVYTAGGAAAAAGVAQLGKSAATNYNTQKSKLLEKDANLTDEQIAESISEDGMGRILLQSTGEAAVEAATVYFAAGAKKGLTDQIGKEVLKQSFGKRIVVNGAAGVIKGTKAYAKEGLSMISDGEFDASKATEEFVASVGAEIMAGEITNKLELGKKMINGEKGRLELKNNSDQNMLQGASEVGTGQEVSKIYEGFAKTVDKVVTKTEAETTKTVIKEII